MRTTLDRSIITASAVFRIHTYDPRVVSMMLSAHALGAAADAGANGEVPVGVYLLLPLVLAMFLLTSLALGPLGAPRRATRRVGGVTRALRADASSHRTSD